MASFNTTTTIKMDIVEPRVQALIAICATILGVYYIFASQERNSQG